MTDDKFNRFRVRTSFDDGVLTTVVDLLHDDELKSRIDHQIVDLKEEHIKQSLVQLGWTPPEDL